MIELTTGIAFLLSSMYGAGNLTDNSTQTSSNTSINTTPVIVTIDRKAVERYIRENFKDTPILIEIARCESTFSHYNKEGEIVRGKVNSDDVGVMQINEKYHLETSQKLGYDIHTIEGNVAYARYLYEKFGAQPWKASSPCWADTIVAMK